MSGSARKRKSLWDRIGEPQLPAQISEKDAWREKESYSNLHGGHDPKWSDLEDNNALRTKDFSGRPSWGLSKGGGSQKDDRRDLEDFPETRKPWDVDRSYHLSSAFDRLESQNRSHSPENSRNMSSRYRRSSRSRSRSRDRDRDRGRGRSRSPSRGMGRSRDRDWDRGRGRGRSRSRSRSPLGNYRQESYRWTDRRRSESWGVPSIPCRDFASGNCRRGSECKFLHQDNLNHKDGGRFEREKSERWRNTQERGGNGYDGGKDEPMKSSGNSTVLCNDFMKGRCNRGSSCRFSHDGDATGYNSERSNRDSSFDHEYKRQQRTNGNMPCKFFMMGNCNRDKCRFSHDGPVQDYIGGTFQDDGRGNDCDDTKKSWNGQKWSEATAVSGVSQSTGWGDVGKESFAGTNDVDEMSKSWNGPKWGEPTVVSDVLQSAGWGNVRKETTVDPAPAEKQTDEIRDQSFEYEHKQWGDATGVSEIERSTGWGDCSDDNMNVDDPANAEKYADVEQSFAREEPPLNLLGLQSKTPYQISKNVCEQDIGQDASGRPYPTTFMHSVFPEDSLIQQCHYPLGDNNAVTDDFSSHGMLVYASAPNPAFVSGQNNNREVDSFPSAGGINQSQHMVSVNPSNGLDIDLNGPVQQIYSPSNLQNQSQSQCGESVQEIVNSTMPLNIVNNVQVGQVSNLPPSLMQIIGNGQLPKLYAALNPPNSSESVPSLPHSTNHFPTATSVDTRPDPASISQTQYDPRADSIESTKKDSKQNSEKLLKYTSPQSAIGFDAVKPHKNEFREDYSHRSPQLRQQNSVADSVVEENCKSIAEKQKQELENMRPGNVDANPRIEDGYTEKDEKAMRLFKNALVEFVKEILKPKWKEGQMSREVHKNIVKKVVDKVTSTIQGANIPKTQDKIDLYLSSSKPKLTKLVEAYTERFSKGP